MFSILLRARVQYFRILTHRNEPRDARATFVAKDQKKLNLTFGLFFFAPGMCESPHRKHNSAASARTSSIEALDTPIPELFRVITAGEPGEALPFTTYTYPAHLDLLYFKPRGSQEFASNVQSVLGEFNFIAV